MSFGPSLPPDLTKEEEEEEEDENETVLGPVLPADLSMCKLSKEQEEGATLHDDVSYGPILPPNLTQEEERCFIGPAVPGHISSIKQSEEEEDELIGPLPPPVQDSEVQAEQKLMEINKRSRLMKQQITKDTSGMNDPQREEWMLELPPEMKAFGLGARKFKTSYVDTGDRSVWTDTPQDREKKAQEAAMSTTKPRKKKASDDEIVSSRDIKLSRQVEDYNRLHRPESLMELHRKRRAAEGPGEKERRPFDRERDLEIPRHLVTASKRQAIAKDSARSLGSKFTHGRQSFM